MILVLLTALLTLILDAVSKQLAVRFLEGITEGVNVIPHVIRFQYIKNPGAAFGMLSEHRWVFMVLSCVAIVIIGVYVAYSAYIVKKPLPLMERVSLGLLFGGGIGNMIDRIRLGYVVDFIDFQFVKFYVFNIADAAVCVGCALLILYVLINDFFAIRKKKTGNGDEGQTARGDK